MKVLSILLFVGVFALSQGRNKGIAGPFKVYPLIVGGEEAEKNEFPYHISLQYLSQHLCGATVLNQNWVITAAHCIIAPESSYSIVAGEHNLYSNDNTEQRRKVSKFIIHENYYDSPTQTLNDIALVRLELPLELNDVVQAIPLAGQGQKDVSGNAWVTGWGYTYENGYLSNILRKVQMPVLSKSECDWAFAGSGLVIEDHMVCAGVPQGGKDSCQGDSGGPMVCSNNGFNYLCGVVSWGVGCGRPGYPGVYTRVSSFNEWVYNNAD